MFASLRIGVAEPAVIPAAPAPASASEIVLLASMEVALNLRAGLLLSGRRFLLRLLLRYLTGFVGLDSARDGAPGPDQR